MTKKLDILTCLMAALLLLAPACSHDDLLPGELQPEEADGPYVELLIAVPYANSLTRGNPLGGEEGNGREQGILNEDKIHDINIFFYHEKTGSDGKGLGMNSADDTVIAGHFYYNFKDPTDTDNSTLLPNTDWAEKGTTANTTNSYYGTQYVSLKFKCTQELLEKAQDINFLAVANVGPITFSNVNTLGKLRSIDLKAYQNTWSTTYDADSKDASKMDYFLMSTAYNTEYTYGGQSTGTNKIQKTTGDECKGTTTLQRLYARLDLWYNETDNVVPETTTVSGKQVKKVKELKYQIKDKDGQTLQHYVYLTNVLPVNVMQSPSFLFKKVTNGLESFNLSNFTDASFSWGGKETPDRVPTSSPNDRPTNYVMERHTTEKLIGGGTPIETLKSWYGSTAAEYVSGKSKYNNGVTDTDCSIENTDLGGLSGYYHGNPASSSTDYGCDQIAIISYANENTHPTDCFHSNYLTGMAFRAIYVPDKIYTGSTTTIGSDDKKNSTFTELDQSVTEIAENKIYRYSKTQKTQQYESLSLYFASSKAAQDYADAHSEEMGVITEYTAVKHGDKWGFVCYYNLWLRHYNNEAADPQETYPMEYATVRNNIYRVAVDFSGPGDPTPTMREPDTMKARIFVRKWNYRKEDPITFD